MIVMQCRAEGADEIRSIVETSRLPTKEMESKGQLFCGHDWWLQIADQIWRPGLRVDIGHQVFYRGGLLLWPPYGWDLFDGPPGGWFCRCRRCRWRRGLHSLGGWCGWRRHYGGGGRRWCHHGGLRSPGSRFGCWRRCRYGGWHREIAGAAGGGGGTLRASTGPPDDGSVGGVDGSGAFWRRFGISAGFSTGGATFAFCAFSWRRRFGWAAACGVFAFPAISSGLASFCASPVGDDFPRRGTPRRSNQIHFAAPLPPWVRMRSLSSRRTNNLITQI